MEPGQPLLDDFVLSCCDKRQPKICLLPTASWDHAEYIRDFYALFLTRNCLPSHLNLCQQPPPRPEATEHLLSRDIIYVSGGHTGKMLRIWRDLGIDLVLHQAWMQGIILAGVSAGAVCWFEEGLTDSNPEGLSREECLGFLKGSFCAHYDNTERRPAFHRHIQAGILKNGTAVDNFAALLYIGDRPRRLVVSRPGASAYSVSRDRSGHIIEKTIDSNYPGT